MTCMYKVMEFIDFHPNERCTEKECDEDAIQYILDQSGKQFDPDVVRAFMNMIGEISTTQS